MSAPAPEQDPAIMDTPELSGDVMTDDSPQQLVKDSHAQSKSSSASSKENLEDYETQLFGFTPKSFVSGVYNAVGEYFMEALQILEEYLRQEYSDTMTKSEVAQKMTVIRKHLVTHIDKAFDTLETYLSSNIFCVPAAVVLPEDQIQMDQPVSEEEEQSLLRDIEKMKKNIMAVRLANATLKRRILHTIEVRETFDAIVERLNHAQATTRQEGVVDLHGSLSHCAQNVLGTLRQLRDIQQMQT